MNRLHASPVRREAFKVLDETDLLAVERRLGYPLPDDYREFVSKYGFAAGGGEVRFRNIDDPSELETSMDVFYGVYQDNAYDLLGNKEGFGDRLPAHIIPVADCPGGLFCLSLAGGDVGSVYWWSPHRGSLDPYDDMELVSPSFDAFVNSLVLLDVDDDG